MQLAEARADVALDAPVRQRVPVAGGEKRASIAVSMVVVCASSPLKARALTVIRPTAVAGTFYPAEPDVLERQLGLFLSEAGNATSTALPKAIIGPHAGYVYSGAVAARAYARLAAARGRISRVVLIGPSHYVAFRGLAVDTVDAWETPCGTVPLDTEAIARLRELPMVGELTAAYEREHALEVHVPFLQHVLGDFRLVPIVAGEAPPEAVAALFDALWGGPETLIVVSTDLSHYLDYAACQRIDQRTAEAIERFDSTRSPRRTPAARCRRAGCCWRRAGAAWRSSGWTCATPATPRVRATGSSATAPGRCSSPTRRRMRSARRSRRWGRR